MRERLTRLVIGAMMASILVMAGPVALFGIAPRLIWNASASAPLGLYAMEPRSSFTRGELVLVRPPLWVSAFAAERGYLPNSVPMVKQIAALSGDLVCRHEETVTLDGRVIAVALHADREGRKLPAWSGCRKLDSGEVFLLMSRSPASFDSRYFGPVSTSNIIGKLVPLWTH